MLIPGIWAMLGAVVAALLGIAFPGPGGAWKAGLLDIADPAKVKPEDRYTTRYLSLDNIPEADRPAYFAAVSRQANSLSLRPSITRPVLIGDGQVIRIDLQDYGWDYSSRDDRIRFLKGRGVEFKFKDVRARDLFRDIWELAATRDKYFVGARVAVNRKVIKTTTRVVQNRTFYDAYRRPYVRPVYVDVPHEKVIDEKVEVKGWIDPDDFEEARILSRSSKFMLRADFFLDLTGNDRAGDNANAIVDGLYSDFLLLPDNERDLYKTLGVDEGFIGGARFATGGAVADSGVAEQNRGLELLPSPTGAGRGAGFLWRTYDFFDSLDGKNVRANFVGDDGFSTLSKDFNGGELIWNLPNQLHAYWAINGEGVRVNEVPTGIARRPFGPDGQPSRTPIIYNWTCVACHTAGIIPFADIQKPLAIEIPDTYLAGLSTHIDKARIRQQLVQSYHLPGHKDVFGQQRRAYIAAVREATGFEDEPDDKDDQDRKDEKIGIRDATGFVRAIETYRLVSVTPEVAAGEMGVDLETARAAWKRSGDPDLLGLWIRQTVKRKNWEDSFGNAMLSLPPYPWEVHP